MRKSIRRSAGAVLAVVAGTVAGLAVAGPTGPEIITRVPGNSGADGDTYEGTVTSNGRHVAFLSFAENLVDGDTNGIQDLFLRDRGTGRTELVSVGAEGEPADLESNAPCLSKNGRYVFFQSRATNLVPDDANGRVDVFLRDRKEGTTRRISVDGSGTEGDRNSYTYGKALSDNGRYAVFYSLATNLTSAGNGSHYQVYLADLRKGTLTLVSADGEGNPADGECAEPSISANGRFVAYWTQASNLDDVDPPVPGAVLVYDRVKRTTRRASVDSAGTPIPVGSTAPVVSNNGAVVAFHSESTALVEGDSFGNNDVFVHDFRSGETRRISTTPEGGELTASCLQPSISANGRTVVFYVEGDPLLPEDTNGTSDVYAFDLRAGTLRLLSKAGNGDPGNGYSWCFAGSLSSNGKWCAISSAADNLANPDHNGETYDCILVPAR